MTQAQPTLREAPDVEVARWRSHMALAVGVIVLLIVLWFLWETSSSLFVLFGGVLFAAFLDACTRALRPVLPIPRVWRLSLVILVLTALVLFGAVRGAAQLPEQARSLIVIMDAQLDILQQRLLAYGIELFGPEGGRDFSGLFPGNSQLFGHAQFAVGTATSLIASTIVIIFVGLMLSFDPAAYRESIVLLVPINRRERVRGVMDEMGKALRLWLVAQAARMLVMGLAVWIALSFLKLPGALLLGVQAGALNFIPFLGPIVAGIPIGLVAMQLGTSMLLWAVGIYTVIQTIEGYVIGPVIQRHAAHIPTAWTLVGIVLIGAVFGTMGVALAMPLLAIGRIALIRFYVEDWLGDRSHIKLNT